MRRGARIVVSTSVWAWLWMKPTHGIWRSGSWKTYATSPIFRGLQKETVGKKFNSLIPTRPSALCVQVIAAGHAGNAQDTTWVTSRQVVSKSPWVCFVSFWPISRPMKDPLLSLQMEIHDRQGMNYIDQSRIHLSTRTDLNHLKTQSCVNSPSCGSSPYVYGYWSSNFT